jgi:hypothetical protein
MSEPQHFLCIDLDKDFIALEDENHEKLLEIQTRLLSLDRVNCVLEFIKDQLLGKIGEIKIQGVK